METLLIGITILFVVYVAYILLTATLANKGQPSHVQEVKAKEKTEEDKQPAVAEVKPAAEEPAASKEDVATAEEAEKVKELKNPDTGETAAVPTNYRFAKRWIKEALVKEGLLDKIYNNTDLKDEKNSQKVKEALDKFKQMKKYWA